MEQEKKDPQEKKMYAVTPEDGFVRGDKLFPGTQDRERARTHFYGYANRVSMESRDPRVHKVFLTWVTRIMVLAGIIALLTGQGALGLIFILFSAFCCKKAMVQVEENAKKENISLDMTREEIQKTQDEMKDQVIEEGKTVFESTFTPSAMETFERKIMPFYIGVCGLLVLGLSYVSRGMAIVVLILSIGAGCLYHGFLKFLVKKSQSY